MGSATHTKLMYPLKAKTGVGDVYTIPYGSVHSVPYTIVDCAEYGKGSVETRSVGTPGIVRDKKVVDGKDLVEFALIVLTVVIAVLSYW